MKVDCHAGQYFVTIIHPIFSDAIYECTINCKGKFRHSGNIIVWIILSRWSWQLTKIKVLVVPLGIKYIEYDDIMP